MLNVWRHPAISYVAIFALVVVAALPASLLADCCCRQAVDSGVSCCQPPSGDEAAPGAACCCSATKETTTSCCAAELSEPSTDAPTSCCEHFATTGDCACLSCGDAPTAVPVITPRTKDAPRVDLTFLAIHAVGLTLTAETSAIAHSLPPGEGYLPPPVRERFCVWTI